MKDERKGELPELSPLDKAAIGKTISLLIESELCARLGSAEDYAKRISALEQAVVKLIGALK
jgi:bacterioferritin (cytochrome b1)